MLTEASFELSTHRSALTLVALSALLGIATSLAGWWQWGLLGLCGGIVVAWTAFLLGLLNLHTLDQRAARTVSASPVLAEEDLFPSTEPSI